MGTLGGGRITRKIVGSMDKVPGNTERITMHYIWQSPPSAVNIGTRTDKVYVSKESQQARYELDGRRLVRRLIAEGKLDSDS